MKTLHLLRHAKSAWDQPYTSDRDRGLNKRGKRDAPRMGLALANEIEPLAVLVSPARRAQLTLAGLCEHWPAMAALSHRTTEALYTFDVSDLAAVISDGHEGDSLFLIGHNPAFTDLVNELAGFGTLENLPTAGYARLSLSIDDWADVSSGCGTLDQLLLPRQLPVSA